MWTLILLAVAASGCAAYKRCPLTPDGFNYTVYCDQGTMHPSQHGFGLTWNLKP